MENCKGFVVSVDSIGVGVGNGKIVIFFNYLVVGIIFFINREVGYGKEFWVIILVGYFLRGVGFDCGSFVLVVALGRL